MPGHASYECRHVNSVVCLQQTTSVGTKRCPLSAFAPRKHCLHLLSKHVLWFPRFRGAKADNSARSKSSLLIFDPQTTLLQSTSLAIRILLDGKLWKTKLQHSRRARP